MAKVSMVLWCSVIDKTRREIDRDREMKTRAMHGRSRTTIDPRIPAMQGVVHT